MESNCKTALEVVKETQVANQMGNINLTVGRLENTVDTLLERLRAITYSVPCPTEEGINKEAESLCDHADSLRSYERRVSNAINKIDNLLDEVEI